MYFVTNQKRLAVFRLYKRVESTSRRWSSKPIMSAVAMMASIFQGSARGLYANSIKRRVKIATLTLSCRAMTTPVSTVVSEEKGDVSAVSSSGNQHHSPAFRAHIDFKFIRDNVETMAKNCSMRCMDADPYRVAELYDEYCKLLQETDHLRALRNENSAAMKGKMDDNARQELIQKGKILKEDLERLESSLHEKETELQLEGQRLPNLMHPEVPHGGEDEGFLIEEVGIRSDFDFEPKDHIELGERLRIIDFESGSSVSGTKFYYLRKEAALLELALINYAMQKVASKGFIPMITPDLVRESVFEKCGFQPRADNTQVYEVQDSGLCLTGTAEVPLGGIYMDKIIEESELPIKMVAFGHCFRTEAGAAGAAGKGLYRVHQFSKVEMFVICSPEQSEALHKELLDIEVEMFSELGLHFKVLDMPSGDLGAPAYRKYDIEAWMPGLERYGEISSASNCTDYQSRRLNIRYRPKATNEDRDASSKQGGKKKKKKVPTAFAHTLNGTAVAVPRMIVAILENFQKADGSIEIPTVLRPFMMGKDTIPAPR